MKDCIFCKIIKSEIPSYKIYEDEYTLAFLDISQCTIGHTLVIPKAHFDSFLTCDEFYLNKVYQVTQKMARLIETKLQAKGFNILTNAHEIAGQSVNHFHVHIIPRYNEADQFDIHQNSTPVDKDYLETIYQKIISSN